MTLSYEMCVKLKEAGFPQRNVNWCEQGCAHDDEMCLTNVAENKKPSYAPTLEELIEACGETQEFYLQKQPNIGWRAINSNLIPIKGYDTPSEAVANLYLAINNK